MAKTKEQELLEEIFGPGEPEDPKALAKREAERETGKRQAAQHRRLDSFVMDLQELPGGEEQVEALIRSAVKRLRALKAS